MNTIGGGLIKKTISTGLTKTSKSNVSSTKFTIGKSIIGKGVIQ